MKIIDPFIARVHMKIKRMDCYIKQKVINCYISCINHEPVKSRCIFPIDSGPIVDIPDPLAGSLALLLHCLCANFRR